MTIRSNAPIPVQTAMVLDHLRRRPITPLDALDRYRCFRLAARIHDLRSEGHKILTTLIHDDASGKRYASYTLIKEARKQ